MRLIVADDSFLTRRGIAAVLEEAGHVVVGEAEDVEGAVAAVEEHAADLVLLDIRMPPTHTDEGLRAAAAIGEAHPSTAVLVLSHHLEPDYAISLIESHPERRGYLLKDRIVEGTALARAVERLCGGECVVDPDIVSRMMASRRRRDPLAALTVREREVLTLVAEGHSNAAIAARLGIADRTVESHTTQVFLKLHIDESPDTNRRVVAVLTYLRAGS